MLAVSVGARRGVSKAGVGRLSDRLAIDNSAAHGDPYVVNGEQTWRQR